MQLFALIFHSIFHLISGDHVECVCVDYDPHKISYKQLLSMFWNNHNYTRRLKRQYTSLILCHNEQQMSEALASLEEEKVKCSPETVYTEISAAGPFYAAEEYVESMWLVQLIIKILFLKLQLSSEISFART